MCAAMTFIMNISVLEAEAEAALFGWRRKWKRKRIFFFQKNLEAEAFSKSTASNTLVLTRQFLTLSTHSALAACEDFLLVRR